VLQWTFPTALLFTECSSALLVRLGEVRGAGGFVKKQSGHKQGFFANCVQTIRVEMDDPDAFCPRTCPCAPDTLPYSNTMGQFFPTGVF
jgi:hypothetical protein